MPIPAPLPRRVRVLAREEVYQQLCTWIIDGTLRPEEALRDHDIAAQLGVSRTPVREALRRLEDEGFVETALNRWTRVAALALSQAGDLYPVVETLEALALNLAAPTLTPNDLATLESCNLQLQQALERGDVRAAVQADSDFHAVWIDRAGNRALGQTLSDLKRKLRRIEFAYFDLKAAAEASVQEHTALVEALRTHDQERALAALHQNWQGSLARLIQPAAFSD